MGKRARVSYFQIRSTWGSSTLFILFSEMLTLSKQKNQKYFCLMTLKLFVKSSSLSQVSPLLSPHYPLFQWYPQSNEILLNLSTKCWNSAFNALGSFRVIIVVIQVGAVKIYVGSIGGAEEKRKRGWNSVYHQNWWKN